MPSEPDFELEEPDTCPRCKTRMEFVHGERYVCPECRLHIEVKVRTNKDGDICTPTKWNGWIVV